GDDERVDPLAVVCGIAKEVGDCSGDESGIALKYWIGSLHHEQAFVGTDASERFARELDGIQRPLIESDESQARRGEELAGQVVHLVDFSFCVVEQTPFAPLLTEKFHNDAQTRKRGPDFVRDTR